MIIRAGIILLMIAVLSWIATVTFTIRAVEVIGHGVVVSLDETKITKNLFLFPSQRIRERLLRDNPLLRNVIIRKKYPHTLVIELVKRRAAAVLLTGDQTVVLDEDGVVLPLSEKGDSLPMIILDVGGVPVGQAVTDGGVLVSLQMMRGLGDAWHIGSITKRESGLLVAKYQESEIFFTQEKDPGVLSATLQTLLTGFRIKGSLPKVIDLRFDKPIVTF